MTDERHLDWPGAHNVRDLGGLIGAEGRRTRRGAVVRGDSLGRLTAEGWDALLDHGVRTIVDLRRDSERGEDRAPRPPELTTINLSLDPSGDTRHQTQHDARQRFGTPLFYRGHLQRYPELSAAVISAIANAEPGGVAFHCVVGRDRSGLTAMLVLALVGVGPDDIAADYELSAERLRTLFEEWGEEDQGPTLAAFLAERGTSAGEVIRTTLQGLDVPAQLRAGGLTDEDVQALRERLLEPAQ